MTVTEAAGARVGPGLSLPTPLDRRFEAVIFDWDGTAVPDRRADATSVRELVERLCGLGMHVAVVSGTHVGNVDGQLGARPAGPGTLHLCLNRGSEVFWVDAQGPRLIYRRSATAEEDAALQAAADMALEKLRASGLVVEILSQRLNRKKIDLIPEPAWRNPRKARIADLVTAVERRLQRAGFAGLPEVVALAASEAAEAGLADARVTSDAKHVEIGLTDKSDSARWILGELWRRGVGPGVVLIVGDEMGPLGRLPGSDSVMLVPEAARSTAVTVGVEPAGVPPRVVWLGGGPQAFRALLEDQLRRRLRRDVPSVDEDPAWTLEVLGLDPELERVHEALLTMADGRLGTRGIPVTAHPGAAPSVLSTGIYAGEGPEQQLLPAPVWNLLQIEPDPPSALRRTLDLRTGVLRQEVATDAGPVHAVQFSSLATPGTVALRAEGPTRTPISGAKLAPPPGRVEANVADGASWIRVSGPPGGVVAAVRDKERVPGPSSPALERMGAYSWEPDGPAEPQAALAALSEMERRGFEAVLAQHREAWAGRWEDADVVIHGDPELQKAVRFALFHLMASVADQGEAAVGARGLSGPAYRGHVFWDSDVFVLPFLAATHPSAARAMLEYRIRRLPAARAEAAAAGCRGARFPWESARTGADVTPRSARDRTGRTIPIGTGPHEEHIVADVAWAAACYIDWTVDASFASGPGRELFIDTARYWASRIRLGPDGRGHIHGVIGPDEYHGPIDDDAFTNVMARWNLRRAAEAAAADRAGLIGEEREQWLELADRLVDGHDPTTGVYEQFAGFSSLEPLVIRDVAPRRPVAADLLLGVDRVRGAQILKQAAVLMLHHMVPDEVAPGSLLPNLAFYEPRTAHGSSLSPGVHAALFAQAGLMNEALEALRLAARIDLDDLTGTTAGGLHLGAMGSVWQALAFGFAGLRPAGRALRIEPRLPGQWEALELTVRFHGRRVRLRFGPASVEVRAEAPLDIAMDGIHAQIPAGLIGVRFDRSRGGWEVRR